MHIVATDNPPAAARPPRTALRHSNVSAFQLCSLSAFLFLLWFILCKHLSSEWAINEQYSYGWFVPFFAAYLFWLRWDDRPWAHAHTPTPDRARNRFSLSPVAFLLLAALLPLRLFEAPNQDWRLLSWIHATIVAGVTLIVIGYSGGTPWVKHFAVPICFALIAVPWPTPLEEPIVQGLMRIVAAVAAEAATLFGIPVHVEGSVIQVSTGLVGVNEACSGVRSLQTSLMLGLLFGELKRLPVTKRSLLLAGATAVALVANLVRAFLLVYLSATQGPGAANRWHDALGYSIVGAVFVATLLLADALSSTRSETEAQKTTAKSFTAVGVESLPSFAAFALIWLIAVEVGVHQWYSMHERKLAKCERWSIRWPTAEQDYREATIASEVKNMLRYDEGRQVSWLARAAENDALTRTFVFFFRWEPGGETTLRARSHRPDICLPSVGWRRTADHGVRSYRVNEALALPFRHFSFVRDADRQRSAIAEAFFCVYEDRVRPRDLSSDFVNAATPVSDWSRSERIRVVREGLRNTGQQLVEVAFVSPVATNETAVEERFARLLSTLVEVSDDKR